MSQLGLTAWRVTELPINCACSVAIAMHELYCAFTAAGKPSGGL
ncbi:MAG: hypothetical protein P8H90_07685 [Tateyamaria sp.]|nr:hypothetical protein [Tateyamaria sp.]